MRPGKLTPEEMRTRHEASRRLMERQEEAMAKSLAKAEAELTGKAKRTPAINPLLEWA